MLPARARREVANLVGPEEVAERVPRRCTINTCSVSITRRPCSNAWTRRGCGSMYTTSVGIGGENRPAGSLLSGPRPATRLMGSRPLHHSRIGALEI